MTGPRTGAGAESERLPPKKRRRSPPPPPPAAPDPDGPGDAGSDGTSGAWIRHLKRHPESNTAWGVLAGRYQNRILVFAGTLLGPKLRRRISPEEVVNEAWMRVIQNLDRFEYRRRGSLYGWLCLQVQRVVADHVRKYDRRPNEPRLDGDLTADGSGPEAQAKGPGPATVVRRRDLKDRLIQALEDIPGIYRRVLVAFFLENRTREEVAAAFDLKPNTVSQQLKRGLELWREAFGDDLELHI